MTAAILTLALLGAGVGSTGAPASRSGHQDIPTALSGVASGTPAARFGTPVADSPESGAASRTSTVNLRPQLPAPSSRAPRVIRPASHAGVAQRQRQRSEGPSSPGSNPGPSTTFRGTATWYGTGGPGLYAALPGYVDGTHVQVAVCAFPGGQARCVTVPVVTQCGCPGSAVVDLSPPAFRALGVPLSVGLVKVTVEVLR